MRSKQIMSENPVTCRATDNLERAAHLMWDYDVGAIPVVDDDGCIVGIITDRDICMAAYTKGASLREVPVSAAMAADVFTCAEDDELEDVERSMREARVHRLPVVDGNDVPVGIISMSDLARYAATKPGSSLGRSVIETLASICEPREPFRKDSPKRTTAAI